MKLYDLTMHEVLEKIKKQEVSKEDVLNTTMNRMKEMDPHIGAYLYVNEKLDSKDGELSGIPMSIKDNICTKNIPTTCASKILKNFIPPYDATVVERLYENGCILIGKTNMDEFGIGSSTENSSFQITKNPWNTEYVPGGSSGGSAASVASSQAYFSLGADTGGSIRQPSAFCGLVGLKPTYGLVSRYGLIAYGSSLDQIGPITKDVKDCAIVLNHIAGYDSKDSTSIKCEKVDYTKELKKDISGTKIGIIKEYINESMDEYVKHSFFDACKKLESLGAIVEEVSIPHVKYSLPTYEIISSSECSSNLSRFDGIRYGVRVQKDESSDLFVDTRSEGFGEEVKRKILLGTFFLTEDAYEQYYERALKVRTLIKKDFNEAFKKFDAVISPTSPNLPFKIGKHTIDRYIQDTYTVAANLAGIPAISIPCGCQENLFIGLQIMGKALDEKMILNIAYAFEQINDYHKKRPNWRG
ncbi:Asp-tRNA(Asn)/Glu-tRNA(Gln) amidotransferase subunit GatA [Inediibacterium massiliense]|uniref:Asp-tRNA(Asn)/Glu-tRNA(Gln) amidotransferase subunit GatA n=1 Tax=Inediibacterium massiliense TaxID=1658111 RepID=UPI0006B55D7B|nr:Asp-tRNA(Asn)/Glu-tRNA(Gln) amidotransferase subunit GatA [Inediibacterium massiliense]